MMKGLSPEHYGITLEEIGLLIAHAKRDNTQPQAAIREQFLVSEEQALEWYRAAYNADLVPDHTKMTRPDDAKNLKRARELPSGG